MESKRVAIVTGAGNGLGAAFAQAIAADGAAVLVNNRRHANRPFSADRTAVAIRAAEGTAPTDDHAVDAADSPTAIVATALDAFGRIDAVVLNAGISGPAIKVGTGDTDVTALMAIDFFANVALVEAALPVLRASPAGCCFACWLHRIRVVDRRAARRSRTQRLCRVERGSERLRAQPGRRTEARERFGSM